MPYHLVNIALHAVNGVLLFSLLRRLRVPAAWLAAIVWVLHPVNVESVAWITELKNTQSAAFFFLALLCFLRFEAGAGRRWYALALLWGLAAMLSKPSTVVLPLVLLLCVGWQRRRWRWLDMVRIAPFFGLALGTSALTIIEQHGHIVRDGMADWQLGVAKRLIIASKAVWFYAAKLLWPVKLAFVYPRWEVQADSFPSWLPLAGLVAVGMVMWVWRGQRRVQAMLFGVGFFVAALLPVLGFFDVYYFRYSYVADHFQYLACIGLISLAVSAGTAICERAGQWGRNLGTLAAAIVLLILGVCTCERARSYQNLETLWRDTLAKNPNAWMAHNNLGALLQLSGRETEAIEHYEQSLQINPRNAEAHNNFGNVFLLEGKVSDAIGHYEQAVRIKPDYAEAHYGLGLALARLGRVQEAMGHYEQALRIKPDYAEAHYELGLALAQLGRMPEAMGHWEQALRINPDYAEAHNNVGVALFRLRRESEAVGHYEQALRIKPDYAEAHFNLGLALARLGRVQEAVGHYERAVRIKPDYAEAHYGLGLALAQLGRIPEAMGHWEQALRINPDYADAHYALGIALEQAGRLRDAIGHYEQALRIKPDFAEARDALVRLQAGQ
jgi:tetratricopeptide (TPR) repeat protein